EVMVAMDQAANALHRREAGERTAGDAADGVARADHAHTGGGGVGEGELPGVLVVVDVHLGPGGDLGEAEADVAEGDVELAALLVGGEGEPAVAQLEDAGMRAVHPGDVLDC